MTMVKMFAYSDKCFLPPDIVTPVLHSGKSLPRQFKSTVIVSVPVRHVAGGFAVEKKKYKVLILMTSLLISLISFYDLEDKTIF